MNKTCLIYQPAGIGDIFYCQGIAKHYVSLGYQVIYPVKTNLLYLKDYLEYEGITFVDENTNFPYKEYYSNFNPSILQGNFIFLNLDHSQYITNMHNNYMESKYKLVNLDYKIWRDEFTIKRNKEREDWLYYDILGLKDGEVYTLLNNKYGTPPNFAEFPIPEIEINNKLVDMIFIEGTNIMDWIKVIENANGIITVDTCIQYIMEKLDLNYNLFYCYTRTGRKDHLQIIKNLFTIPWSYQTLFEK